ncbi:MAG: aspartate aminotransferase family protein [Dehalococcoidales bacterium]|nr:aspartate aminotransferase family protein [Dehalococcoidales bacterium]
MRDINDIEEMRRKIFKHMFVQYRSAAWLREPGHLKIFEKGEGVRITDVTGKTYIDGAAGWQYGLVGHGRMEIGDAIHKQIGELAILAGEFVNIPSLNLAEKLATITPGNLTKVSFCSSGSEAVETGMKIARQYHVLNGEPRRHKVITRRGSYHGATWGCMSVTGVYRNVFSYFEPMVPMAIRVAHPYCYRCSYGLRYPHCDLQCAREIERVIVNESPDNISAVLGEPISHSCYVAVPPPEYWPMVRSICDKYGVLLVNDCVLTGFGRTGKWFACEHWDYVPDVICFAKGITSGYTPAGGAITTSEIAEKVESGPHIGLVNINTWGGNAPSAAGALANIAILEREQLIENSAKMGEYLLEGLRDRLLKYPIVGDVRGMGLMVGIETVADRKTKAFFEPEVKIVDRTFKKLEDNGLLCREFESTILLTPPLCISKSDIDEIITILDKIIAELALDLGY